MTKETQEKSYSPCLPKIMEEMGKAGWLFSQGGGSDKQPN
jgi:hypothetical protein